MVYPIFSKEYKMKVVYFTLQYSCRKFTTVREESLDEIK